MEGEYDHSVAIRNLLTNIQASGGANSGGTGDCVAQLLAAAVAQLGNQTATISSTDAVDQGPQDSNNLNAENLTINPEVADCYREEEVKSDDGIETVVEIPTTVRRKSVWAKFPVELRKRIIAMRKEGKKYVEVAKELNISVSGAQKVWERFLATGLVHDRKPSTYAGRPRKYARPPQVCPNIYYFKFHELYYRTHHRHSMTVTIVSLYV